MIMVIDIMWLIIAPLYWRKIDSKIVCQTFEIAYKAFSIIIAACVIYMRYILANTNLKIMFRVPVDESIKLNHATSYIKASISLKSLSKFLNYTIQS